MNQKTLFGLLAATALLALVYAFAVSSSNPRTDSSQHRLLDGVRGESVAGLQFEQGSEKLTLELKDGQWEVPARDGYQADASKIRAFLLKLFDLEVSQKIPADDKSAERLGVSDESVKRGMGYISLLDSKGGKLIGIRLGEARKGKDKSPVTPQSGQYVRRDDGADVYLIGSPVALNINPANWIDVNLISVLPSSVRKVVQAKHSENAEELMFELDNTGQNDKSGQPVFTYKGELAAGKAVQDSVVAQVRSALENFRISDVRKAGSDELKDLNFDFLSKFSSTSGLVYSVETAEKDSKSYVHLSVAFDAELANALKEEAAKDVSPEKPLSAPDVEAAAKPSPSATPSVEKKPELKLSDATEAKKLNDQLQKWVYEIPVYNARKLRFTLSDLTEPPPPPPKPEGGEFMPDAGVPVPGGE